MDNSTGNADEKRMSDVALARKYVGDIGGPGKVKEVLHEAFRALQKRFPHEDDPENRWTERRVRSFWTREAAKVEFREMIELHLTAKARKSEMALLKKAKAEHAEFIARTKAIEDMLSA